MRAKMWAPKRVWTHPHAIRPAPLSYDRLDVFWQWIVGNSPAALRQTAKITVRQNVTAKKSLDASTCELGRESGSGMSVRRVVFWQPCVLPFKKRF